MKRRARDKEAWEKAARGERGANCRSEGKRSVIHERKVEDLAQSNRLCSLMVKSQRKNESQCMKRLQHHPVGKINTAPTTSEMDHWCVN